MQVERITFELGSEKLRLLLRGFIEANHAHHS